MGPPAALSPRPHPTSVPAQPEWGRRLCWPGPCARRESDGRLPRASFAARPALLPASQHRRQRLRRSEELNSAMPFGASVDQTDARNNRRAPTCHWHSSNVRECGRATHDGTALDHPYQSHFGT
jgi:hypothetical protein